MNTDHDISFESIAGITPVTSTFTDVMNRLGTGYRVERVPSRRNKRGLTQAKVALHFQKFGLAVVFNSQDFSLLPETPLSIVGAESGCPLRTDTGLHIGMPLVESMEVVEENYTVSHRVSGCVEIIPYDRQSQTFLALHHDNDRIVFIGLHRR